jgi:Mg-chelatase subunit ChlI
LPDLIGDIDPIKAANLRLSFADERVIHYGIIREATAGIFVINEIPGLAGAYTSCPVQHFGGGRYTDQGI